MLELGQAIYVDGPYYYSSYHAWTLENLAKDRSLKNKKTLELGLVSSHEQL